MLLESLLSGQKISMGISVNTKGLTDLNQAETLAATKKWGHGIGSFWEHGFHLELNQTMTEGAIKTTFLTLCCMHWIFLFILLILVIVVLLLSVLILLFFDWSNSFPATVGGGKKMAKILYHTVSKLVFYAQSTSAVISYSTITIQHIVFRWAEKTWWCEESFIFKQITHFSFAFRNMAMSILSLLPSY